MVPALFPQTGSFCDSSRSSSHLFSALDTASCLTQPILHQLSLRLQAISRWPPCIASFLSSARVPDRLCARCPHLQALYGTQPSISQSPVIGVTHETASRIPPIAANYDEFFGGHASCSNPDLMANAGTSDMNGEAPMQAPSLLACTIVSSVRLGPTANRIFFAAS